VPLKDKWNPPIHLSLNKRESNIIKGKCLGKGISYHMGHESIFVKAMGARWQQSKACDIVKAMDAH